MAKSVEKKLKKLPLGAIKPQGWLLSQMQSVCNLQKRIGSLSGLVKDGEWMPSESLPRYVRGLILLAYTLDDEKLKEKVASFMTPIFTSANEGGDFGPDGTRSQTPKIEAIKTLLTYYQATQNERVLPFLKKYFKNQFNTYSLTPNWYDSRARLLEEIEAIEAVYRETDLEWLRDLAERLRDDSTDWFKLSAHFPYAKPAESYLSKKALKRIQKRVLTFETVQESAKRQKVFTPEYAQKNWNKKSHQRAVELNGVNIAKAVKYPAIYGRFFGDDTLRSLSLKMIESLDKYHGTPLGMFACSPYIGDDNTDAVDVQASVEMLESLVEVLKETGDYSVADMIERITFNVIGGACLSDCSAVQDTLFINQIATNAEYKLPYGKADNAFYAKKISRGAIALLSAYPLYMQTACMVDDDELNFLTYTPCTMDIPVGGGRLTISEKTSYPFRNTIVFRVERAEGDPEVKINFRVPCNTTMQLISGGQVVASGTKQISVKCVLKTGSTFMLRLNIPLTIAQNRDGSQSMFKSNVLMALKLPCDLTQDATDGRIINAKCTKKWNVTPLLAKKLVAGERRLYQDEEVVINDIEDAPLGEEDAPFELLIRSKNVLNWESEDSLLVPKARKCAFSEENLERAYVPFGCTITRIAKFPKCLKKKVDHENA